MGLIVSTDNIKVLKINHIDQIEKFRIENKKFIPVAQIGSYIVVGPYTDKNTEGCPQCVAMRMHSNIGLDAVIEDLSFEMPNEFLEGFVSYVCDNPNKAIFYDPIRKNITARRVLSFPQCPVCSSEKQDSVYEESKSLIAYGHYRSKKFDDLVIGLKNYSNSLLDGDLGILKGHYRGLSAAMPLIAFDAKLGKRTYDSYGRADTYESAYYTGLLEGLERYHGVYPNFRLGISKSENDLQNQKEGFIPMHKFLHYETSQYNEVNFALGKYSKDLKINWTKARNLVDDTEILIPEQVAYFSTEQVYEGNSAKNRYIYESSNGTALGSTYDEAVLSSLFEYVERDGFFVYWYNKAEPVKLTNIEELNNDTIKGLLRYMAYLQYKVHVFDITLESEIPAIWVILESLNENNTMAHYNAAGANICPIKALESALIEATTAVQVFSIMIEKKFDMERRTELIKNPSLVSGLEEHLFLYSAKEMRSELSFALDSSRVDSFHEHFNDYNVKKYDGMTQHQLLDYFIGKMKKYHGEILVHDMSSSWLREMGLYCVKTMIPSMQTVSFGHQYRNINKKRIVEAIEINGLVKKELSRDVINMMPHPFP